MPDTGPQVDLVVVLLFASALLLGGLAAVLLGRQPEKNLFLVGVGYAFMGHFMLEYGSVPLLFTQVVGVFMAARAELNDDARFAALMVGVMPRLGYWTWEWW